MEVGHALHVFMESIEERKNSNFLSMAIQKELERAAIDDDTVTKERVQMTTNLFYGLFSFFFFPFNLRKSS